MIGGHHADRNAGEYWQAILRASEEAMRAAEAKESIEDKRRTNSGAKR
jgi:hypothetical protein